MSKGWIISAAAFGALTLSLGGVGAWQGSQLACGAAPATPGNAISTALFGLFGSGSLMATIMSIIKVIGSLKSPTTLKNVVDNAKLIGSKVDPNLVENILKGHGLPDGLISGLLKDALDGDGVQPQRAMELSMLGALAVLYAKNGDVSAQTIIHELLARDPSKKPTPKVDGQPRDKSLILQELEDYFNHRATQAILSQKDARPGGMP